MKCQKINETQYQKINEIQYLRTFEAADAIKSYRASLWTENYKALGAMALGVFLGAAGITSAASSSELRIFDLIKNISVYKRLEISPEGIEMLSTVAPWCIGMISALSAVVFQIGRDDRVYHWENYATMILSQIDSQVMLHNDQYERLMWGAPLEYRSALSKYTVLSKGLIRKSNDFERAVLNHLYKIICGSMYDKKADACEAAIKQCKSLINDNRVIEVFFTAQVSRESLCHIKRFAEREKFQSLADACTQWKKNNPTEPI